VDRAPSGLASIGVVEQVCPHLGQDPRPGFSAWADPAANCFIYFEVLRPELVPEDRQSAAQTVVNIDRVRLGGVLVVAYFFTAITSSETG
jgi:hypothetical protein